MSNILAGFVKGFTGVTLDQMERREQAAAEMKKAEMLEQLRRETAQEMALLQDKLDSKRADDKLSTTDYKTGKRTLRNSKGEVINSLDVPLSEMEAYDLELQKTDLDLQDARLGLDVKRANIAQSEAAADTSRAYASRARRLDSSSGGGKGGKDKDEPDMLVAEYERTFEELKEGGASPAVLANFQTEFHRGVTEEGWNKTQQRAFFNSMRKSFTDDWVDNKGYKRKPLYETYGRANATLDKKRRGD